MTNRFMRCVALLVALGLVAAACGDDGGDGATPSDVTASTTTAAPATTLAPQKGGSVTMATFAETPGIDPILISGAGTTGGNENAAVFDRLIVWNPVKNIYEMRIAESVTNNTDFTEFTIKIRPNVKFGDGTAYDATAVKFNFDRQKTSNAILRGVLASMKDVTVVDTQTVKVTLTETWPGFMSMLANALGMIASPTAIQKLGKDFSILATGAGAGPFEVSSFKPKESLTLKRNPTYWGGDVYLDEVRFVNLGGAQASLDAVKTGTIDMAFLREASPVANAKAASLPGFSVVISLGEIILVNHGVEVTCAAGKPEPLCTGKADNTKIATTTPGSSKKVRQALLAAIDPAAVDQRANDGKGIVWTTVLDKSFPWNPSVDVPKPNVDNAKKLVQEAKAEGWDGKIRLECTNTPARKATSITLQTNLTAAGIQVDMSKAELDQNTVIADVITNKNYDLACWGIQLTPDDWAFTQADSFLRSTSGSNRTGYKSAAMDAALAEIKKAATDDAKKAAWKKLADLWVSDVVSVGLSAAEERTIWAAKVQGVAPASFSTVELTKAWIKK